MLIERTNKEVIIRLPASIDTAELQRLVDYLTYKEATCKFKSVAGTGGQTCQRSKKWVVESKPQPSVKMKKIVIDTNIIFSTLLNSNGTIGDLIFNSDHVFTVYSCDYTHRQYENYCTTC